MTVINNINIEQDFEKIVIKHFNSQNKLVITFKKKKPKIFLENWRKKLNEFVEENNLNSK